MGDGKTVNSPIFDDLGGEPSITIQGRSNPRMGQQSPEPTSPSTGLFEERTDDPVAAREAHLRAAGFRKVGAAWRR